MTDYKVFKKANFYLHSRFEIKDVLGKGSYGVVCLAVDTKSASSLPVLLAIKKVKSILDRAVLLKRAIRELRLMRHLRGHRNVCSLMIFPSY